MIDLELARQLKQAGLAWKPTERDTFAITAPGLEGQIFVVSQFTALIQSLHGRPAITFHGSAEWALDYVLLDDVVWLPSETQLREALEARLPERGTGLLRLERTLVGYRCTLGNKATQQEFSTANAAEAYGYALLHVLTHGFGD